eukprot:gene500-180_t
MSGVFTRILVWQWSRAMDRKYRYQCKPILVVQYFSMPVLLTEEVRKSFDNASVIVLVTYNQFKSTPDISYVTWILKPESQSRSLQFADRAKKAIVYQQPPPPSQPKSSTKELALDDGEQISKWPEAFQRHIRQTNFLTPPTPFRGLEQIGEVESPPPVSEASRVKLHGIKSRPLLNELEGVLGKRYPDGRWLVMIDKTQEMSQDARKCCEELQTEYQASFKDTNFEFIQYRCTIFLFGTYQEVSLSEISWHDRLVIGYVTVMFQSVSVSDCSVDGISFTDEILPLLIHYSIFEDRDLLRMSCVSKSMKNGLECCSVHLEGQFDPMHEPHSGTLCEAPLPHSTRTLKAQVASLKLTAFGYEPPHRMVVDRCSQTIRNIDIEQYSLKFYTLSFENPNLEAIGLNDSNIQQLREDFSDVPGFFVPSLALMPNLEHLRIQEVE